MEKMLKDSYMLLSFPCTSLEKIVGLYWNLRSAEALAGLMRTDDQISLQLYYAFLSSIQAASQFSPSLRTLNICHFQFLLLVQFHEVIRF